MEDDTRKYLNLIGAHLQDHHAALLVGAGFSRNAAKVDDSMPDSPDWSELTGIFVNRLSSNPTDREELKRLSPLVLAEHIEVTYGRPELDHLLQSSIRDRDFLPSILHRKLLSLPWSDIFTTNYDTLLERASDEITEKSFMVVTGKEDLIGSSGTTRIVKLHGSFPSQRPFIITSEDYRTYPRKFAPFVNTVQQSLLENTLCLIGFSGNDPNFENWIGWIRDNLGKNNSPNIYLLLYYRPSEAERQLMHRRNIVPVDLSQLAPNKTISAIYEAALDYLLTRQDNNLQEHWDLTQTLNDKQGQPISMENAVAILREIRESYPGWVVVPSGQREVLRYIASTAERILARHCAAGSLASDIELEYLYEYDWLREKTLLPPFGELKFYHQILERHTESNAACKRSIQLSLLRDLRENGDWAGWDKLSNELHEAGADLNLEQRQQLQWEKCLCSFVQYQFPELKSRLKDWKVEPSMSLWALRKASILAEYGELEDAYALLEKAILNIRKRMSHQRQVNLALLSLESVLMYLQSYISQALYRKSYSSPTDREPKEAGAVDSRRRAFHAQYDVAWEEQNSYFISRLEAAWKPYQSHREQATFDFGEKSSSFHLGTDENLILAYSFLRFREECGIPFYIGNVQSGAKAACGAAERIALYAPFWSILTLVRADKPKAVENTITRGVLSSWTREEADRCCQFYLDAILRTEPELNPEDGFYRGNFACLAADVLPEVLSVLCTKCSSSVLNKAFDFLKSLYFSEKKLCYQQAPSLAKRLFAAYPPEKLRALIPQLLLFPIKEDNDMIRRYFPNPLKYIQFKDDYIEKKNETSLPEVDSLFAKLQQKEEFSAIMNQLLYCLYHGFLTDENKLALRDLLWERQELHISKGWLRTVCLDIPAPPDINILQYLSKVLTEEVEGYSGQKERSLNDIAILLEIRAVALKESGAFSDEQISIIISCFASRLNVLSQNLSNRVDFMGLKDKSLFQLYEIAHTLWLLTVCKKDWIPSDANRQVLTDILGIYNKVGVCHYGLQIAWHRMLETPLNSIKELAICLRSAEKRNSRWAYEVLATSLYHPQFALLTEEEIHAGITVLSQQIVWGVPKQLASALRVAEIFVNRRADLISDEVLESLLTGLSQLKQQTVINIDDTVESASDKGNLRVCAASLAKRMQEAKLHGDRPEILNEWLTIIKDENEFAEIRNV